MMTDTEMGFKEEDLESLRKRLEAIINVAAVGPEPETFDATNLATTMKAMAAIAKVQIINLEEIELGKPSRITRRASEYFKLKVYAKNGFEVVYKNDNLKE